MAIEEKSALLQNSEEVLMKKKVMAIEKINMYMQKLETMKIFFDPLPHFTLHSVLSQLSPEFYTEEELTQIEKVNQILYQEENISLVSQNKMERTEINNLKRCRPSNEASSMSDGGRRVKPKLAIKRKPRNHKRETLPSPPPPELPNHVNDIIKVLNGIDIKYIMCKTLCNTDLSYNNKRLSMPISQIRSDFLTEIEKSILETRDQEGKPATLKVTVLDPCLNEFSLHLKKWNMTTTSIYNLAQDWTNVLSKNNFRKNQKIDIWSFRVNDKLYFLLDTNESEEIEEREKSNKSIVISTMEEEKKSNVEDC
ncbi:hypothetical protein RYX36_030856 [Vicia faba]